MITELRLDGDLCYHVINRSNARRTVFHDDGDYRRFESLLVRTRNRVPMRILAYCLMPNHFHLCLWPQQRENIARFMHALTTAHVRQHHLVHRTEGRLWQGRYRAYPVENDEHLLTALRYIERNPLRGGLVRRAAEWPYSSLCGRNVPMDAWPVERPRQWRAWVESAQTAAENEATLSASCPTPRPPRAARNAKGSAAHQLDLLA